MEDLKEVLLKLDTEDDSNWTSDGQVRLDVLKALTGNNVSRKSISLALPGFSRTNQGTLAVEDPEEVVPTVKQVAPASNKVTMEQANKLLDEATKLESEINAKVRDLRRQADVIISQIDSEDSRKTTAHDIQAFQKSQFEQRKKAAESKVRMAAFLEKQ
jgi:hypothetical protein